MTQFQNDGIFSIHGTKLMKYINFGSLAYIGLKQKKFQLKEIDLVGKQNPFKASINLATPCEMFGILNE